MWSDTTQKYQDARIIFTDTETSNWTWDPVAKAYYWHRFFRHQPDLNFDNPHVRRAILRVMRFWLDMGVDGLRLDAVPYLVEREGTNCENLPETHAILKQMRAEVDRHYENRMLLAEANQWPADVRPYFGDGDECHMAFHFPLMPRIFMALRQEDRHPIIDILEQTPDIPDTCQWALFLRNHDELTLEMVTDEERDYMYRAYAADPQMRLNVGIRRRLAPLMENSRRRIELLNSLLFSLPGTPIIYYGDEIGMGDNIYLGDRNGVRTPMQWTADRNAGFSRADPARLYAPPIMDPVYGYEAVNVEAQERSPFSLLNWMSGMIALRRQHRIFGRGTLRFISVDNRKILAYARSHDDQTILAVANLSRTVQPALLDLAAYKGLVPVEVLGGAEFPRVADGPYFLTLAPYASYWFALRENPVPISVRPAPVLAEKPDERAPLLAGTAWDTLLDSHVRVLLEREYLPPFLQRQRWFGGKSRAVRATRFVDWAVVKRGPEPAFLSLIEVEYATGPAERYFVPLALGAGSGAEAILTESPQAVVARLTGARRGVIYDGTLCEHLAGLLFSTIAGDQQIRMRHGAVRGRAAAAYREWRAANPERRRLGAHDDARRRAEQHVDRVRPPADHEAVPPRRIRPQPGRRNRTSTGRTLPRVARALLLRRDRLRPGERGPLRPRHPRTDDREPGNRMGSGAERGRPVLRARGVVRRAGGRDRDALIERRRPRDAASRAGNHRPVPRLRPHARRSHRPSAPRACRRSRQPGLCARAAFRARRAASGGKDGGRRHASPGGARTGIRSTASRGGEHGASGGERSRARPGSPQGARGARLAHREDPHPWRLSPRAGPLDAGRLRDPGFRGRAGAAARGAAGEAAGGEGRGRHAALVQLRGACRAGQLHDRSARGIRPFAPLGKDLASVERGHVHSGLPRHGCRRVLRAGRRRGVRRHARRLPARQGVLRTRLRAQPSSRLDAHPAGRHRRADSAGERAVNEPRAQPGRESAVAAQSAWNPTFGAFPGDDGCTFRVWSSAAQSVRLALEGPDDRRRRTVHLNRVEANLFEGRIEGATGGTLYRYLLDAKGPYPDPASRFQPSGVHGPSEVIDWTRYRWTDSSWSGVPFEDLVIYELHVGTFTRRGTFLGIVDRLGHLSDLGITAVELMPVAAFAGRRNWGYDGAALFAPACEYGRPEDLQHLVDRAHGAGLAVLLDVVCNHLGPDGAYPPAFSPDFFSEHHQSPWGSGVNLDGPGSSTVRRFLIESALHWIVEYHVDGLRLDATHALADDSNRHFLADLAASVHTLDLGRPLHVIAEDERNLATIVRRPETGGMGLDGVWADDFHHEVHRMLTGEAGGYYADYSGRIEDIATTINQGWFYTGQHSKYAGHAKGSDAGDVDRQQFVFCLQNHDQVGNRAVGERLNHLVDLPFLRAAAAVLLFVPETPLLFMGEEWAASTPFLYFTDHRDELGRLVTKGRRSEFARFAAFSDPDARTRIPDPQDEQTFAASRLNWNETGREPHASMIRLYRALLAARGRDPRMTDGVRDQPRAAQALDSHTLLVRRSNDDHDVLLVACFGNAGRVELPPGAGRGFPSTRKEPGIEASSPAGWAVALTTEDPRFATDPAPVRVFEIGSSVAIEFARPSAVILRRG